MNTTSTTATLRLYTWFESEQNTNPGRVSDVVAYRVYIRQFLDGLSQHSLAALSPSEANEFWLQAREFLVSLAPVVAINQGREEYAAFAPSEDGIKALTAWREAVLHNYAVDQALATIDTSNDPAIDEAQALQLFWCLLYNSSAQDLDANVKALAEWLLEAKRTLSGEDHHHHLLLYVSRDPEDGNAKGGNGKTFVADALREVFATRGLPTDAGHLPLANTAIVDDSFSRNILLTLNEMGPAKDYNIPLVRDILEDETYRTNRKYRDEQTVPVRALCVGTSNAQDWLTSVDEATARRVHLVNVCANLALHKRAVREQVNALHPLPTKEAIAEAFLALLRCPEEVLEKLAEDRENASITVATDTSYQEFVRIIQDIKGYADYNLEVACRNRDRIEVAPAEIMCQIRDGEHRYHIGPKQVNELLNRAKGTQGKRYTSGSYLRSKVDVSSILYDFSAVGRMSPVQNYENVWAQLHGQQPRNIDKAPDSTDSTDSQDTPAAPAPAPADAIPSTMGGAPVQVSPVLRAQGCLDRFDCREEVDAIPSTAGGASVLVPPRPPTQEELDFYADLQEEVDTLEDDLAALA